ncbi:peptide chain release factor N(5)-glutamine methyltransferase [Ornithinimicrobium sp. Arc0846-15]|nr:peptide chain release factor N(5)-glutamine methyltransferase [Ornithinimicrobium laminariae]
MTEISAALRTATGDLSSAGVPSPRADAEILLAHVLQTSRGDMVRMAVLGKPLSDEQDGTYTELIRRRVAREPLQHLTGTAPFADLELLVGPGVFVPRPETETLVAMAAADLAGISKPIVVDLCTGSGAIPLALRQQVPSARVIGVELSPEAHAWAKRNATHTGLDVDMRLGDAGHAADELIGLVDLVTCNPPYVPTDAIPIDPEVAQHDPSMALYGGSADGLAIPLAMAARAAELLKPGGVLLMEHADVQRQSLLAALSKTEKWADLSDHDDPTGRPRVARAVRA